MMFDIKTKKDENREQTLFHCDKNANELKKIKNQNKLCQKNLKKRFETINDNEDIATLLSNNVDSYVKLFAKNKVKIKNIKIKKNILFYKKEINNF